MRFFTGPILEDVARDVLHRHVEGRRFGVEPCVHRLGNRHAEILERRAHLSRPPAFHPFLVERNQRGADVIGRPGYLAVLQTIDGWLGDAELVGDLDLSEVGKVDEVLNELL